MVELAGVQDPAVVRLKLSTLLTLLLLSMTCALIACTPSGVPAAGGKANERVPSPAVTSPLVPSSKSCWLLLPPALLRSAVAVRAPLLPQPLLAVTVIRVLSPGHRPPGVAEAKPLGFAFSTLTVMVAAPV